MSSYLNPYILDNGLAALTDATGLYICSAEPTSFAEATSFALGHKSSPTLTGPADATPDGRKMTIAAFTDGAVDLDGTVIWWALVDTVNSRYLAGGEVTPNQSVVASTTFSFSATTIRIPAAV